MTTPFIMLVDDEVPFVETMTKRLATRNIETIVAFSGEEGLEKLKTNQNLDVIILDIKMPGIDGMETLKKIKEVSPLIEVILLTGYATIELGIDGMKIGAIVQARMGSARLPGKVLMDISGKPMIWHIINRLKKCKMLNEIVIASTLDKTNDVLEEFANKNNINILYNFCHRCIRNYCTRDSIIC